MSWMKNGDFDRLHNYVELHSFDTEDEAGKIYIILGYYKISVHMESRNDRHLILVPSRDFEFCKDVLDSILEGRFDNTNVELMDIFKYGVGIDHLGLEHGKPTLKEELRRPFSKIRVAIISSVAIALFLFTMWFFK